MSSKMPYIDQQTVGVDIGILNLGIVIKSKKIIHSENNRRNLFKSIKCFKLKLNRLPSNIRKIVPSSYFCKMKD